MRSLSLVLALLLAACQTDAVQQQTAALTLAPESMGLRQIQTRRFDTRDEGLILSATAGVLQDLGFTIEETAADSGLIVGSKDRAAIEAGQVAGQLFFAALVAALGGTANPIWDQTQKIRVSIVTKPSADNAAVTVRVTFQRVVWNNQGQVAHVETINEATLYQKFYDKLSQAAFLEAHQI